MVLSEECQEVERVRKWICSGWFASRGGIKLRDHRRRRVADSSGGVPWDRPYHMCVWWPVILHKVSSGCCYAYC